ncbi:MAG TPA: DUF167 domain-containing protein [Acidimicrobiales bacterium]
MVDDLLTVEDDGAVVLAVHASPGAGRSLAVGRHGSALKVRIAAPPEGGRANDAIGRLLAEELGVPAADVTLVSGAASRHKRYRIAGADVDDLRRRLERLVDGAPSPGRQAPRDRRR